MHKRGDTLIEVMFAVAIFGMAAIGTISLMNKGLASTQNTLETTMARQEIDAQAEALRFLHSAYLSEPKKADATELSDVCTNPSSYRDLWKCLVTSYVYDSEGNTSTTSRRLVTEEDSDFYTRTTAPGQTCDDLYRTNNATKFSLPSRSFVLNPRSLDISDLNTNTDKDRIIATLKKAIFTNSVQQTNNLDLASTYPRLLYANTVNPNSTEAENLSDATMTGQQVVYGDNKKSLYKSEGLWITGVASPTGVQCVDEDKIRPDYYDFHIQTCWDSTVNNSASTIESTVRLFNPDQVSLTSKKNSITFANTNWNKWDNTCNQPQCEHSESYYSSPGDHIDTSDPEGKKIVLTGYGCTPANQGTYIDIEPSDTMTVSLNLAVSTFNGHPGGFFLVKLGPLSAILSSQDMTHISFLNDTRTVQEMPTGETTSFSPIKTVGISGYSNVTIVLEKSGTHYKGYIEGNSSEFVEFDNDQSTGLQLAFWMSHYDHCCNIIYKATATVDITLPPSPSEEGGCYRTETPVANNDTIDLSGDDDTDPQSTSTSTPEPEPEPASTSESEPESGETAVEGSSGSGSTPSAKGSTTTLACAQFIDTPNAPNQVYGLNTSKRDIREHANISVIRNCMNQDQGSRLPITNTYDQELANAVTKFQKQNNIWSANIDGRVGKSTRCKICQAAYRNNSSKYNTYCAKASVCGTATTTPTPASTDSPTSTGAIGNQSDSGYFGQIKFKCDRYKEDVKKNGKIIHKKGDIKDEDCDWIWKRNKADTNKPSDIYASGCSFIAAVNALKKIGYSIDEEGLKGLTKWARDQGWTAGGWSIIEAVLNKYSVSHSEHYKPSSKTDFLDKIKSELQKGNAIIAYGHNAIPYTDGGHYVTIVGVTSDNKIVVTNSVTTNGKNQASSIIDYDTFYSKTYKGKDSGPYIVYKK